MVWNKIKLDWKAYFAKFVEKHGEPVQYEGLLLFRDGWRYGSMDHQGPEYPPPEDEQERIHLKLTYWVYRRNAIWKELIEISDHVQMLKDWQDQRELPLQQIVVFETLGENGEVKEVRSETEDLNLTGLEDKIRDLQAILDECNRNIPNFVKD